MVLSNGCRGPTAIKVDFERPSGVVLQLLIHKTKKKQETIWNTCQLKTPAICIMISTSPKTAWTKINSFLF